MTTSRGKVERVSTSPDADVRAPRQERSARTWDRVLAAAMELFAERGWDGLTIAEVCRRSGASAPSIYARVDGKAGLFRAAHVRWLTRMAAAEREIAERLAREPIDAVQRVARLMAELYDRESAVLRAVIDRAVHDADLRERGSAESRALVERLAAQLPMPYETARETVESIYADCVLRVLVGDDFLRDAAEPLDEFAARLERTVRRRI